MILFKAKLHFSYLFRCKYLEFNVVPIIIYILLQIEILLIRVEQQVIYQLLQIAVPLRCLVGF